MMTNHLSKGNVFYVIFVVSLLITEFFYINLGGGIARLYHFWVIFMVFLLKDSIPQLLESSIARAMILFSIISLIASVLSDSPDMAVISLLSSYANTTISFVIALMMLTQRVTVWAMYRILIVVTIVSIFWGLTQIIAFNFGLNLALSIEQKAQIRIGFGPGFKTEANTFGKFMVLPFLLFFPSLLYYRRNRFLKYFYGIMLIGVFMNFTRTAIYGIGFGLLFAFFWYTIKGTFNVVGMRLFGLCAVIIFILSLVISGYIPLSEYAMYKLENIFNQNEIIGGQSSAYRIQAMNAVIENTFNDLKRTIIGNGWGQTIYIIEDSEVQAGGGDLVNILGFTGILGCFSYLFYMFLTFVIAFRLAWRKDYTLVTAFSEGVLFALVGMFFTGQMAGYLISPEYYLLLGICIYLNLESRRAVAGGLHLGQRIRA